MVDAEQLKESITFEQVFELLEHFGGEPTAHNDSIISRTICHGGDSNKLFYYDNNKIFRCYTHCGSFDIIGLVMKVKNVSYGEAIKWLINYFKIGIFNSKNDNASAREMLQAFDRYDKIKEMKQEVLEELVAYDGEFLNNLPLVEIPEFEQDGISFEIIKHYNIRVNPLVNSIIVPQYDVNNNLVGIRERNLEKDRIEKLGKYRPAVFCDKMYNCALNQNLYGININKEAIKKIKKAIVYEAEKSVMLQGTKFGLKKNFSVASYGSYIYPKQVEILINLGVEEIIFAPDHDFVSNVSQEAIKVKKRIVKVAKNFRGLVNFTVMLDRDNVLGYKSAPIECDKEEFLKLYKNRLNVLQVDELIKLYK